MKDPEYLAVMDKDGKKAARLKKEQEEQNKG
jgi:hypothetical protein